MASGGEVVVKGDLDRPFSYLHEEDLADLCIRALEGDLGTGVLNAAAAEALTMRGYYELLARHAGIAVRLSSDGTRVPSRRIDATRLHRLAPDVVWRAPA